MENKESQILSEMAAMIASVRSQIEALENKMTQLQQMMGAEEDDDMTPIDLELDDIQIVDDDLPFSGAEVSVEPEAEPEAIPEVVPEVIPETEPELVAAPVDAEVKQAVIDSMLDRQAWRTDMPGSPVRDIRSAISLNDRILFINALFGENPMIFQEALSRINQMETLDEAVGYLAAEYPDWDFESEVVYRFMMAVRRKVK